MSYLIFGKYDMISLSNNRAVKEENMKKRKTKLLAVLLAAVLAIPTSMPAGRQVQAAETEKQIQILATSDLHGKFVAYDYAVNEESTSGSVAQAATLIRQRRNDNTVLIDVGDTIESNSASLFFDEEVHPMIAAFNLLNYDVWVAGNHEFNYGIDTLLRTAAQFTGTFLCGNVYKDDKSIGDAYKLIERDGVKIAVIGYTTPNIVHWDAENLKDYKVTNPLESGEMKAMVEKAKEEADIIVAALHMAVEGEFDLKGSGAADYAEAFPDIDVILASHGHELRNETDNGVLIIENVNQGQTLADIDISVKSDGKGGYEVTDKKAEMITVKDTESDAQIVEALAKYDARAKEDAQTVVGKLEGGDLVPETEIPGITQSQIQETAMVNLINQAQLYYGDADVSAAAVFSPSANMKEGEIKKCDMALIYKFDNTLYRLEVTGKQLKQYMEWSAAYYNTYKDGDLTISFNEEMRSYLYDMFGGVKYKIDISKEPGSRIQDLTRMDGTEIRDTDTLVLAVNNYRANSQLLTYGSVFSEGEELPKLLEKDTMAGEAVRSMIGKWITEKNNGVIRPELSNNWEIVGTSWNEALHEKAASLVKEEKISIPASSDGRTQNVKAVTVEDLKDHVSIVSVKLDANGGTASTSVYYAEEGQAYGNLPAAVRDGYEFAGWYTNKTGGTKVTDSTKAQEGTLYARWTGGTAAPGKAAIKSLKAGTKSLTVAYGKVADAEGYMIDYSLHKSFKDKKTVHAKKTSATIKKLSSGKTYYVRVRTYVTGSDAKKVFGKASSVKKVTVK